MEDGRREGGSIYICFGSTTLYYFYLFRCCSLIDVISAARKAGVVHVYIATIYPAQHPQYTSELQSLLNRVPGQPAADKCVAYLLQCAAFCSSPITPHL